MMWFGGTPIDILTWLTQTSVQASVLVLLILSVQAILREKLTPRWRYAMWMILLVRLILPWGPESVFSLYNWVQVPTAAVISDRVGPKTPVSEIQIDPSTDFDSSGNSETDASPIGSGVKEFATNSWSIGDCLILIWLAGAILMSALVLWQGGRYGKLGHRRPVTDQKILDLLEDCKDVMGIRTYMAVVETSLVGTPSLFGVIRPRLLLPPGVIESSGPEHLRHIFLHELAHLKRNDVLVNWLMAFLQIMHWFNPVIWYAFYRMRVERELACDALALSRGISDPREYGKTVVHLLEGFSRPRKLPGLVGILENKKHITRRITMIAKFKKNAYRLSLLSGVVIFVLGLVTLTNAASKKPSALDSAKAEMMGRVEDFLMHNFRDVTWRKSLEWGNPLTNSDGSQSIRYMYKARIWDRETLVMNQTFQFDKEGSYIRYENVEGFPKKEEKKVVDTKTSEGMKALVEDFFRNNFRDITSRKTIEWGDVVTEKDGNSSIRCMYEATIWHKDKKIMNQIFTFDPTGKFVNVKQVDGYPKDK